jgi:hypothetical protein
LHGTCMEHGIEVHAKQCCKSAQVFRHLQLQEVYFITLIILPY